MKYLFLFFPLIFINCVTTEQGLSIEGKVFNTLNGSTIVVGYLTTEDGLFPGDFKNGPNEEFINYPEMAYRAGIEGTVELYVDISETGEVTDVKVTRGIGAGCDGTAWETIKNSEFTPAKDGNLNLVSARHYISFVFKL